MASKVFCDICDCEVPQNTHFARIILPSKKTEFKHGAHVSAGLTVAIEATFFRVKKAATCGSVGLGSDSQEVGDVCQRCYALGLYDLAQKVHVNFLNELNRAKEGK